MMTETLLPSDAVDNLLCCRRQLGQLFNRKFIAFEVPEGLQNTSGRNGRVNRIFEVDLAIELLRSRLGQEFLTKPTAQQLYGEINFEYPVNPAVSPGGVLQSFGDFKRDELAIEKLAELASAAQKIIDRIGW